MELSAIQIAELLSGEIEGSPNVVVNSLCKIEEGKSMSLSFLANGNYELTLVQSGETATSFKSQVQVVSKQDTLDISLAGLDGFVGILEPLSQ